MIVLLILLWCVYKGTLSNKEAKRIYDKLKYFLENNTLGDVREIQNVLEKGGN